MSQAGPAGQLSLPLARHAGLTGIRDALHAEWTKLRTVTGPAWLLIAMVAATVAISTAANAAVRCPSGIACPVDTAKLSLTGIQFGQAVVAILAVLVIGGEYSTGMIRTTLTAMPRRIGVLAAKAAVLTGLVVAAATTAVGGSLLAGRLILPGHGFTAAHGFPPLSLGDGPVLRAAAGSVLYLGLIALLSLGIATAVREPAAAIGLILGLLYLVPIVAPLLDQHWQRHLEQIGPTTAGLAIQATTGLHSLPISPWAGLGVLAAWAAAALLAGGLLLRLRDA
ncbi:MAG: ABC transporter permease [Streptosporangiaceae bacterium]